MSRSQARAARRHRNRTYPGPNSPEDAAIRAARGARAAAGVRAAVNLAALAKAEQEHAQRGEREIPIGGSGRRRAKAARNAAATRSEDQ